MGVRMRMSFSIAKLFLILLGSTPAIAAPSITSLSPNPVAIGATLTVSGNNFGSTQGTSTVTFDGVSFTPATWSNTAITGTISGSPGSGPVVVHVGGVASNSVTLTIVAAATITSLSTTSGPIGTAVTINGTNFGSSQGSSNTVTFGGSAVTPRQAAWSE
jgi:hypothetical protein